MLMQMAEFPSFSWLKNILFYIYIFHSFVDRHLGHFHILAIVNNAAVNIGMWVSPRDPVLISFGYVPRTGNAGSCGSSIFNFFEELP